MNKRSGYVHSMKFGRSYIESDELFANKLGFESICNLVRNIDVINGLVSLSKVVWILEDKGALNRDAQLFLANNYLLQSRLRILVQIFEDQSRLLFFRPQVHSLMKLLAIYGQYSESPESLEDKDLVTLGTALLATTDLIARESRRISKSLNIDDRIKSISVQLITGEYLISSRRLPLDVARSKKIYVELHNLFKENPPVDYVDIEDAFFEATGVDISTYLEIGFGLILNLQQFRRLETMLPSNPNFNVIHSSSVFNNSLISDTELEKIFNLLSIPIIEFKDTVKDQSSREISYDFLKMKEKPLLNIGNDLYIPFSYDFFCERLTTGIYWIIFDFLKEKKSGNLHLKFSRYNGLLFEKYVKDLSKIIHLNLNNPEEAFIGDEVYLIGKQELKTPDAMIIGDEYIIVIEATSSRITANRTLAMGIPDAFMGDCEKIIFRKARELDGFLRNLENGNVEIKGNRISWGKKIYPLIVTLDSFPKMTVIDDFLYQEIQSQGFLASNYIEPLSIISVDELEDVAKNDDYDFLDILKSWHSDFKFPYISLSLFIEEEIGYKFSDSKWFKDQFDAIANESMMTIFGVPYNKSGKG